MMLPKKRYVSHQRCPNCGGPAKVRNVRSITPLVQEHYLHCKDDNLEQPCGWTGVGSFEIVRTVTQGAIPNPRLRLPVAPTRARPFTPPPPPANDDEEQVAAVL